MGTIMRITHLWKISLLRSSKPSWVLSSRSLIQSSFDYNYLEKSTVPTDFYQASLPLLPLPELEFSCKAYLSAVKPLIDNNSYERTTKIVEDFKHSIGKELHNNLINIHRGLDNTSYIAVDWLNSYLTCRLPLPINFNPFFILENDPKPEFNEPCIRASNLLISFMRLKRSLDEKVLSPDVTFKKDLSLIAYDMSQYSNLFCSTRIPSRGKDYLQTFDNSKHILVMKDGAFFILNILDDDKNLKSPGEIYSAIKKIYNTQNDTEGIGVLTTLPRDDWATARETLCSNPKNIHNFVLVDSAILVLCLDKEVFECDTEEGFTKAGRNFLHGSLIANRWFDKSFSIITTPKVSAISFEHSCIDGITLTRAFNRIYEDQKHYFVDGKQENDCELNKLEFHLDNDAKFLLNKARQHHAKAIDNLHLKYIRFEKMNKSFLKSKKLSTDAMFQLSFQMAFYKIFGITPTTYESCSTTEFKHGRTDVIRAATLSTQKACQMFESNKHSIKELRSILEECSQTHSKLVKNASIGQNFDRHWFALNNLASKMNLEVDLFKDQTYFHSNYFRLSTSCLFTDHFHGGGYGPAVPDGIGCAYGFSYGHLGFYATNFKNLKNGYQFADAVKESMEQIFNVLSN